MTLKFEDHNTGEFRYANPEQSPEEKLAAAEAEITNTQVALADTYEQLLKSQEETTQTQIALTDVYETLISLQEELAALKGGSS
ncbi:hypothetical protein D3C87_1103680 [compost metagenome]